MKKSELFHIASQIEKNYSDGFTQEWQNSVKNNQTVENLLTLHAALKTQLHALVAELKLWDMTDVKTLIPALNKNCAIYFKLSYVEDLLLDKYDTERYSDEPELHINIPYPAEFEQYRKYCSTVAVALDGTSLTQLGYYRVTYLMMPVTEIPEFYKNTDWQKLMFELGVNLDEGSDSDEIDSDNSEISSLFYHQ